MKAKIFCLAAGLLATQAAFASLKDATVAFKSGNWTVLHNVDQMTDKVSCTGIYKNEYGIQLTEKTLYIDVKGGVNGVTLRFGEDKAQDLRLATDMEKKIGSVIIEGKDFNRAIETGRVRYQVITLVRGSVSGDIDATGVNAVLENINNGCPLTSAVDAAPKASVSSCSDELIKRMKTQGITETQIKAVCQ